MQEKFNQLKSLLMEVDDLNAASAVLYWDQSTYMPPGGASARGRQLATLGRLAHEKFIDDRIGKLLEELKPYEASLDYDSDQASLLRVARREFERSIKVPPEFTARFFQHTVAAYDAWSRARPENDFGAVQPYLEKSLDMSREYAGYFPGYEHIADPLIAVSDYGMKASTVRELFGALRDQLVPMVDAITSQPPADDACLRLNYPVRKQLDFGEEVIRRLGFDFERARQDMTHHPFMIKFSIGDVRITTRARENFLGEALFSTIHEAGHAMYELGLHPDLEATPLADGTSSGVHESQSRLWENIVGRGRQFWTFFYPRLQERFPSQLGNVPVDTFYRAINRVGRSLIRTDADEVTYNLHVILRFDLELDMLEDKLSIAHLPEAWHARYETDLGIRAPDDRDGVLQDVHWYSATIGGVFQGYTLGNIMSAQFYEAANASHPGIPEELERGEFGTLHRWLKENIYRHGSKFTAAEIMERATGAPLHFEPYIRYLHTKYGELYDL